MRDKQGGRWRSCCISSPYHAEGSEGNCQDRQGHSIEDQLKTSLDILASDAGSVICEDEGDQSQLSFGTRERVSVQRALFATDTNLESAPLALRWDESHSRLRPPFLCFNFAAGRLPVLF